MRILPTSAVSGSFVLVCCLIAQAQEAPPPPPTPVAKPLLHDAEIGIKAFVQPAFRYTSDNQYIQPPRDDIGFVLTRARLVALGGVGVGPVRLDLRFETDATPQFSLFDAWVRASGRLPGNGAWQLKLGQHNAPFSRQVLAWHPDLQMTDRATFLSLAPQNQLGLSGVLNVPFAPWIEISAGVYNGDGRNIVENVDQNLMYVARLAFRPIGTYAPLVESALGPDQLSFAGDVSYNTVSLGDYDQTQLLAGADAFFSRWGLSVYGEFLWGQTTFSKPTQQDYHSLGLNVQAGYLLPIPGYMFRRIEITARYMQTLLNDTVPLKGGSAIDPNQDVSTIVAGLNYFQFGHHFKLQVNYLHYIVPEDVNRKGRSAEWDAVLSQITYVLE